MVTPTLVWLFDVDGTLLLTDGAGRRSISAGLEECYGIREDLATIPMGGNIDPLIVSEALRRHGLALAGDADRERLWTAILAHMRKLMDPPRGGLLPGVGSLIDRVTAEPAWVSGLLTGNIREMARIKLAAFGIDERFAFGAFGDEAPNRDALAVLAVQRAGERYGVSPDRCVVVGDTELDVRCARAAGARAVAVATGSRTREELAAHAPDLLLDDFTEPGSLLEWARRI